MKVYFEYGHKCNDNEYTVVTRHFLTWRWNWFFISEAIKDIFREIKFCRKMKYTFFIHKRKQGVLEEKAEEYADKNKTSFYFAQADTYLTDKEELKQAYLADTKELEQENNKLLDVINNQDVKIADLEKQIEKMKCCGNCKNEGDYKELYRYGTGWCNICTRHKVAKGNFDKWELKEIEK